MRSANNLNISEEDLYRIGNIFLYTISNLNLDGLVLRDVIQNIRESMVVYNTNQVFSILDTQVTSYDNYLDSVRLATETQLEERVQEFHQEVNTKDRIKSSTCFNSRCWFNGFKFNWYATYRWFISKIFNIKYKCYF